MQAPQSASDMKDEEASKVVVISNPVSKSFGAMTLEQVEAEREKGLSIQRSEGAVDPFTQAISMNGRSETSTTSRQFAIDDTVYHKVHKKEGKVVDVAASGKVQVKFKNAPAIWVLPRNIVKL